jgi:methionyl-tRNA formyltransferase
MPIRFLVLGEGWPAKRAVRTIQAHTNGHLVALISPSTDKHESEIELSDFNSARGAEYVRKQQVDWVVSANNIQIVGEDVLREINYKAINLHPAPLPEYAGLHCHQWAIRNGDRLFGVTIHVIGGCIDSGDIIAEHKFVLSGEETGLSLFIKCMGEGASLLEAVLNTILSGRDLGRRQQDLSKRRVYRHSDAITSELNWQEPAERLIRFIRACNYEPFASPTYSARLNLINGDVATIISAIIGDSTAEEPGNFVRVSESGIHVAAGDRREVVVTKAKHAGIDLSGHALAAFFGSYGRAA